MNSKLGRLIIPIVQICFLVSILAGCGYTTKTALAPDLKTIHIDPFKNKINFTSEGSRSIYKTYTAGVETTLTNSLVDRFIIDGSLRVVSSKNADLILSGELIDYRKDPVRYNADNEVEEYRVNILVDVRLYDSRNNKMLWELNNYGGDTSTFVEGNLEKSDDTIVREASFDLVRRIVEKTVEAW
ncbi:MAG: LptE family protein [Candidatus Omnitrophota bacterium]